MNLCVQQRAEYDRYERNHRRALDGPHYRVFSLCAAFQKRTGHRVQHHQEGREPEESSIRSNLNDGVVGDLAAVVVTDFTLVLCELVEAAAADAEEWVFDDHVSGSSP
jgi:hypothetical protein